jgi:hypothetical protein
MTGRPAAFSAFALASTASVADSEIAAMRSEIRLMTPSSQTAGGRFSRISWLVGTRVTELMHRVRASWFDVGVVRHVHFVN